jgi:hypothetical protein
MIVHVTYLLGQLQYSKYILKNPEIKPAKLVFFLITAANAVTSH